MNTFNQPTYQKIKESIRERIVSGEIESGSRLTIQELSNYYQVSQMPIREALQWLQGEGILAIIPHRGAIVRKIDSQMIRNDYDIRAAIEDLLVKRSFEHITEKEIEFLEKKHTELREALHIYDIKKIIIKDREMHLSMYNYANNPDAIQIYDKYSEFLGTLRERYGIGESRRKDIENQHELIIEALKRKDIAMLLEVVRVHNDQAKSDLLLQMSQSQ